MDTSDSNPIFDTKLGSPHLETLLTILEEAVDDDAVVNILSILCCVCEEDNCSGNRSSLLANHSAIISLIPQLLLSAKPSVRALSSLLFVTDWC